MIQGALTALITPFSHGALDEGAFRRLIVRQIEAGVHGLVPAGTTGEASALSAEEHARVLEICVETAAGRVPVIAGAGAASTAAAIAAMRRAKTIGADAALVVAPYYVKPSQEGLYAHFAALNDAVQLPMIVYNIPARTGVDIRPETMARIAALPNVIGLKDSAGEPSRTTWHQRLCGEGFIVLAGDDHLALGFAAYGARGCVSVASNVAPALCANMQDALAEGDLAAARVLHERLAPLFRALFLDASPGPVKDALARLGLCSPELRLPLVGPSNEAIAAVDAALSELGLAS